MLIDLSFLFFMSYQHWFLFSVVECWLACLEGIVIYCKILFSLQKLSFRDRQSSHTRNQGGNYNYDRKDHHEEREGSWNNNPRPRSGARGQSQNQGEKSSFRTDRSTANNRRSDRSWNSKQDPLPRYHHRNSFRFSNSTNRGSTNASYGMYPPVPAVTTSGVPASVVMFYSFDQNVGYNSPDQHLEFVGPAHFTGDKVSPHSHEDSSRDSNEQQDIRRDSDLSSPDQPSSPWVHRYFLFLSS